MKNPKISKTSTLSLEVFYDLNKKLISLNPKYQVGVFLRHTSNKNISETNGGPKSPITTKNAIQAPKRKPIMLKLTTRLNSNPNINTQIIILLLP